MTAVSLTDADLLQQFEHATLPAGQFRHVQHVRVAWLFVRRHGLPEAFHAFPAALRRFADAQGAPHLYHVTVTWAYLVLIHARQEMCHASSWEDFASANSDLLDWKPSILDRYYTAETLWSEFARQTFVLPDRGRLER